MECERATLYIVDHIKKEIWSMASLENSNKIRLPLGTGIAGYVAKTKEKITIDDAYLDHRFNKDYDLKSGYRTKSILCIPIIDKVSGECIGF